MNIEIHNQMNVLGRDVVLRSKERIEGVFSRYMRRIRSIRLTASDVSGPRGGIHKQCRVLVSINGMDNVVATVDHHSLSIAIGMAIQKAERAVARRIQKSKRK